MNFDLAALQSLILDDSPEAACSNLEHESLGTFGRVLQILSNRNSETVSQSKDLAPLLRQVLLENSPLPGRPAQLGVPETSDWPTMEFWESNGFEVTKAGTNLILSPALWRPEWLKCDEPEGDIFQDTFARKRCRQDARCAADPFLLDAGYASYSSAGQREAVRASLLMPPGTTLVVNLPTGSGKSLVGHAPVLIGGLKSGLTVFIVPTTALALDQERRLKHDLQSAGLLARNIPPLAYYSGASKSDRQKMRNNIREGCQGILFCSPEAFSGSLLYCLYEAAEKGTLNYLVVDEAHVISAWGDSFRPDFQRLAGMRRGLLEVCPNHKFKTILLSATLAPATLDRLYDLFGPKESVHLVSAVHLRPEPGYWTAHTPRRAEKEQRISELLTYAPRPLLLYLTERTEANDWYEKLSREGYSRVDCFTGDTPDAKREQVIKNWNANKLDIIVATSAFGVGVDKDDVRTVIHGAMPENLDRFYQEVGRGGRDGCASVSVLCYTDRDLETARALNRPGTIKEYAFDRWKVLYDSAQRAEGGDVLLVDLSVRPPHIPRQTDLNATWNLRTLVLMARAGLIRLESVRPPTLMREHSETDQEFDTRLEQHFRYWSQRTAIRVMDPSSLDETYFENAINLEREAANQRGSKSLQSLVQAISGEVDMGAALAEFYRSNAPGRTTLVSKVCRTCQSADCPRDSAYQNPTPSIPCFPPQDNLLGKWLDVFPGLVAQPVFVTYDKAPGLHLEKSICSVIHSLVSTFPLRELVAPADLLSSTLLSKLHKRSQGHILFTQRLNNKCDTERPTGIGRITVFYPWEEHSVDESHLQVESEVHVMIIPSGLQSNHPLRHLEDINPSRISLDVLKRRLEQ